MILVNQSVSEIRTHLVSKWIILMTPTPLCSNQLESERNEEQKSKSF